MNTPKIANAIACCLLIYFLLVLHIPFAHPSGSGLYLPENIIAWCFMATVCFIFYVSRYKIKPPLVKVFLSPFTRQLGTATIMLAVPLFYTSAEWRMSGFVQWLGIAGGFMFYFCLTQIKFTQVHYRWLLVGLAGAAFFQAIVGAFYLLVWLPESGEWYAFGQGIAGILKQKNIAATFMTVGLGAGLLLWLDPIYRDKRISRILPPLVMLVVPFMLVFLTSRIGILSCLVLLTGLLILYWRQEHQHCTGALVFIVNGVLAAYMLIWLTPAGELDLIHKASTQYRLQMLLETLKMIAQHPLMGWGLGSFSYHYAHFLIASGTESLESAVVLHPHNEWLYGWAEGGIVTVSAYLVMVGAGWKLWVNARQKDSSQGVVYRQSLWLLLLPMLLHTQVEYPFYLSTVLWLVFLLLLALQNNLTYGHNDSGLHEQNAIQLPRRSIRACCLAMGIISLLTLGFMVTGLQSGLVLTSLERAQTMLPATKLANIDISGVQRKLWNPWIFMERFEFDRALNYLLRFNVTRDPQLLMNYLSWSTEYLSTNVQPDIFASQMMILNALGHREQAESVRANAQLLYPKDTRFMSEN